MSQLQGKNILVIGANGAFGAAISEQLIEHGARVLGTARSAESSVRLSSNLAARLLLDLEQPNSIQILADYLLGQPLEASLEIQFLTCFFKMLELTQLGA